MNRPVPLALLALQLTIASAGAQASVGSPQREAQRRAIQLDGLAQSSEARVIWQRLIDSAATPAARAAAHRRMAMSYGFTADCAGAVRYHSLVIDYWRTREVEDPQNAHYQQGEMANEAARVCLDAGDLAEAERLYRLGDALGTREPEPRTHPRSLWAYRTAHALGRIAARRGDAEGAARHVADARRILDGDAAMAADQERWYPALQGYVAYYLGDLAGAERALTTALGMRGNERDAFLHGLMAMTHDRMSHPEVAREWWAKAYALAEGGHNPPSAFARREGARRLAP